MSSNKKRFPLRHANAYGSDWANVWSEYGTLNTTEYLSMVRVAQTGAGQTIRRIYIENNNLTCGVGPMFLDSKWYAGQWTDLTSTFTNDTTDAQSGVADSFALETLIDGDGHIVCSTDKFSAIWYFVTTGAVAGAGYVQEWSFWNGGTWETFTPEATTAALFTTPGVNEVILNIPVIRWAPNTTLIPGQRVYAIRYRATDAPDTAALASRVSVLHPYRVPIGGPDDVTSEFFEDGIPVASAGESLWAYHPAPAANQIIGVYGVDEEGGQFGREDGR